MGLFKDLENENLFKLFQVKTSSGIFVINSKVTPVILIIYTVILTISQYSGDPILCKTNLAKSKKDRDFYNTYCWMHGTKSYSDKVCNSFDRIGTTICGQDDPTCERSHEYYQWIALTLVWQAVCFYIPGYLWNHWERKKVSGVVGDQTDHMFVEDESQLRTRANQIFENLSSMRANQKGWAARLVFLEIIYLVNIVGQLLFTDFFLGHQFLSAGQSLFSSSFLQTEKKGINCDPMSLLLPIKSECLYTQYSSSSQIDQHNIICVLPTNAWNQKFYTFFFVWLICLLTFNSLWLVYRVATIFGPIVRKSVLTSPTSSAPWLWPQMKRCDQFWEEFSDWVFGEMVYKNTSNALKHHLRELMNTSDNFKENPETPIHLEKEGGAIACPNDEKICQPE